MHAKMATQGTGSGQEVCAYGQLHKLYFSYTLWAHDSWRPGRGWCDTRKGEIKFSPSASDPSPMEETMRGMQSPSQGSSYYQSSGCCSKGSISHQTGDMLILSGPSHVLINHPAVAQHFCFSCRWLLLTAQVQLKVRLFAKIILFFPLQ